MLISFVLLLAIVQNVAAGTTPVDTTGPTLSVVSSPTHAVTGVAYQLVVDWQDPSNLDETTFDDADIVLTDSTGTINVPATFESITSGTATNNVYVRYEVVFDNTHSGVFTASAAAGVVLDVPGNGNLLISDFASVSVNRPFVNVGNSNVPSAATATTIVTIEWNDNDSFDGSAGFDINDIVASSGGSTRSPTSVSVVMSVPGATTVEYTFAFAAADNGDWDISTVAGEVFDVDGLDNVGGVNVGPITVDLGSCCHSDSQCSDDLQQGECTALVAPMQPANWNRGDTCATNPCGVCCHPNGCIDNVPSSAEARCENPSGANGVFQAGGSCAELCGACCVTSSGSGGAQCLDQQTQEDCDALIAGGFGRHFPGSSITQCADNTNQCGACCNNDQCTVEFSNECTSTLGGAYAGTGGDCPDSCGSCCSPDGCQENVVVAGASCSSTNGVLLTGGTCADDCEFTSHTGIRALAFVSDGQTIAGHPDGASITFSVTNTNPTPVLDYAATFQYIDGAEWMVRRELSSDTFTIHDYGGNSGTSTSPLDNDVFAVEVGDLLPGDTFNITVHYLLTPDASGQVALKFSGGTDDYPFGTPNPRKRQAVTTTEPFTASMLVVREVAFRIEVFESVDPVLVDDLDNPLFYTIRIVAHGYSIANRVTVEYELVDPPTGVSPDGTPSAAGIENPSGMMLALGDIDASRLIVSGSMYPDTIIDITFPVEVTDDAEPGIDVITLRASVENEDTDGVPTRTFELANDDTDSESTSIAATLDLFTTVTVSDNSVVAGADESSTVTVTVGNYGPATASNVHFAVNVELPDGVTRVAAPEQQSGPSATFVDLGVNGVYSGPALGRIKVDSLEPDEEVVFEFDIIAAANAATGSQIGVHSLLESVDQSPLVNTDDDEAQATISVTSQIALTVSIEAPATLVLPEVSSSSSSSSDSSSTSSSSSSDSEVPELLTMTVNVVNNGPSDATNAVVHVVSAKSFGVAAPQYSQRVEVLAQQLAVWHIAELRAGESASLHVTFPVGRRASAGGSASVEARVKSVEQTLDNDVSSTVSKRFTLFVSE